MERGLVDRFREKTGLVVDAYFFSHEAEMDSR